MKYDSFFTNLTRNTLDCDQSNYSSRIVFSHTPIRFGETENSAIRSAAPWNSILEPSTETAAASFLGYLYNYIVSQYTVRLMTPCAWRRWRILCLRNSSSVPYFRQPPNFRRNRKCTECGKTAFGRNRISANLFTFGTETETETEIRSTSGSHSVNNQLM